MISIWFPNIAHGRVHIVSRLFKNSYDPSDISQAMVKAMETEERIPIGVIYKNNRPTYTQSLTQLKENTLVDAKPEVKIEDFVGEFA